MQHFHQTKNVFLSILIVFLLLAFNRGTVIADTDTPTPSPTGSATPTSTPIGGAALSCVLAKGSYTTCTQVSSNTVRIDFNVPSNQDWDRGYYIHNSVPSILYFWFHWDAGGWWYRYGHDANNTSQARGFSVGLNGLGFYNQAGYFAPVAGNGTYRTNAQGNYWIDGTFVGGDYSNMSNGLLPVRDWEITIARGGFGGLKDLTGYSGTGYLLVSSVPISATPTPTATSTSTPTPTFTPTITSTPPNSYTYNRTSAVTYADNWAHLRNTNYPLANETDCNCNDCTNYISQVLHNGGYPLRTGDYDENSYYEWWFRDPAQYFVNYSTTWSATNWLNVYLTQYPNEFDTVSSVSTLEGGDFILLDLRNNDTNAPIPDGKPDHGRIVVGYGNTSTNQSDYTDGCGNNLSIPSSTYVLLANQHCTDRWHVAWNYNIQDIPRWYIHIID